MAILVIASFLFSWMAFVVTGYFVTPLIPAFSPEPVISGYIGFFSGVISLGVIPLIALIWLLFKVLWGYQIGPRIRRGTFGIWAVSLFLFVATMLFGARNFVHDFTETEVVYEEKVNTEQPLILDLKSGYDDVFDNNIGIINLEDHLIISRGELYLRNISVELIPTQSDYLSIVKTSHATGQNKRIARKSMEQIKHDFQIKDNVISISDYTQVKKSDRFRMQSYRYTIKVPINSSIQMNGDRDIIRQSNFVEGVTLHQEDGSFIMTDEGLTVQETQEI